MNINLKWSSNTLVFELSTLLYLILHSFNVLVGWNSSGRDKFGRSPWSFKLEFNSRTYCELVWSWKYCWSSTAKATRCQWGGRSCRNHGSQLATRSSFFIESVMFLTCAKRTNTLEFELSMLLYLILHSFNVLVGWNSSGRDKFGRSPWSFKLEFNSRTPLVSSFKVGNIVEVARRKQPGVNEETTNMS